MKADAKTHRLYEKSSTGSHVGTERGLEVARSVCAVRGMKSGISGTVPSFHLGDESVLGLEGDSGAPTG